MVDLVKTLKKAGVVALAGAVTGLLGWLNAVPLETMPAIYATLGIVILTSVQDIIKHWNDA